MKSFLPLDIKKVVVNGVDLSNQEASWVVPYTSYEPITDKLVMSLVDGVNRLSSVNDGKLDIVLRAKAPDISSSITRILRNGLEIHSLHTEGICSLDALEKFSSTYLHKYLIGSSEFIPDSYDDTNIYFKNYKTLRSLRAMAGRAKRILTSPSNTVDVLQRNDLMNRYFSERKMSSREIYPFHLVNWSRRNDHALNIQLSVKELSNVAIDSLNADIQNNSKLIQRIRNALEHVISEHLIEGFGYLRVLLRWKNLGFCGNIFYSGTPKLVGRLLSAILREEGKEIVRFTHGGERGLFNDRLLAIADLTYSDKYYTHGGGERKLITERLKKSGNPQFVNSWGEILASPSSKHHEILTKAQKFKKRDRDKTVIYVSQSYTGEGCSITPSQKPPDVLVYEWQLWLIRTLKNLGYRVILKPHPRGEGINYIDLSLYCDGVIEGHFNPNVHQADCLIFDFAGTAMMDTLASQNAVVYLDHGVREYDALGKEWLEERVQIVDCHFDEQNRIRTTPQELSEAIETSSENDWLDSAENFVGKYFT